MKSLRRTVYVFFIVILMAFILTGGSMNATLAEEAWASANISETETTEAIINPDVGFYKSVSYKFTGSGNLPSVFSKSNLSNYKRQYGLLHYRFGLERYSANAGGADAQISADDLTCLERIFTATREVGGAAIIRFSYNVNGEQSNGRYKNNEPSMSLIKQHIAQLGTVINKYLDVVVAVETGMIGPWGEQHSTELGKQMADGESGVAYEVAEAWLNAVANNRSVSVRRPLYYVLWAQRAYPGCGITIDNLDTKVQLLSAFDGKAYRLGVFNDGYLGNSTDLGTFSDREKEVKFLNFVAGHTYYGGEVVTDDTANILNDYNNARFISIEGYKTHTSYLNIDWDDRVIAKWKGTVMSGLTGDDAVYNGKNGKDYVANRLGYRLLVKNAESIVQCGKGGVTGIRGSIYNVGFANVVNERRATVIFSGDDRTYSAEVDLDIRNALSGDKIDYEYYFRLPSDIPSGVYDIYIRFNDRVAAADAVTRTIRFANKNAEFSAELGANKVGMVYVNDSVDKENAEFGLTQKPSVENPPKDEKPDNGGCKLFFGR